jgi:penicillin-binding protein 1A
VILDKPAYRRVIPASVAATIHNLLTGVVTIGTGKSAAIPGVWVAGKTGTTSNYGDAWFVGWTPQMTVAVWVGYPDRLVPMTTDFNGGPVEGGTYPALIWHNFMVQALQILASEQPQHASPSVGTTSTTNTLTLPTTTTQGPGTATSGNSGAGNGAAAPNGGATGNSGATKNGNSNGNATGNSGTGNSGGSGSSSSGGVGLGGGATTGNSGAGTGQSSGTTQNPPSSGSGSGSGGG